MVYSVYNNEWLVCKVQENTPKVKSLYKALCLLDYFNSDHPERGIKELSDLSGMLKSSVYNILSTFQMCGFIEKDSSSGKYKLGKKILTLSNVLYSTDSAKAIIKPYMDKVAEECSETVFLAFPSGTDIIYVEGSYPPGVLYARSIVGVKAEMYCTGIGKAILAYSDEALIQMVVDKGLEPFTSFTLSDEKALREDLEKTRQRGYSIDNMEHEYGIRCVGVPLHNNSGHLMGALSISGPSLRVMDDKVVFFAEKLQEAANEIKGLLK